MTRRNIWYVGNYKSPWSSETFIASAMERRGHRVWRAQENAQDWSTMGARAAEWGADLWLFTRTWFDDFPAGLAALDDLRARGIPSASLHLDLYIGLQREPQVTRENPFWSTDHVLTADGDPNHARRFAELGINHHWLRPGVESQPTPGHFNRAYKADVAFFGAYRRYHVEHRYRAEMVTALMRRFGREFRLFGAEGKVGVRGSELSDAIASCKVIVGDSCNPGFALTRYWSDRVYETLGRGGFMIHPFIEGMEQEFTDGKHLRYYTFGNLPELCELVEHYRHADEDRREIAEAGRARAMEVATWEHRVDEMLAVIGT